MTTRSCRRLFAILLAGLLLAACSQPQPDTSSVPESSVSSDISVSEAEKSEKEESSSASEPASEAESAVSSVPETASTSTAEPEVVAEVGNEIFTEPASEVVTSAPAQSSTLQLTPDDITIYIQDAGQFTVSDLSAEADIRQFVDTINSSEAAPGNKNPGASQEAAYLVVRNDYTKFQYTLTSPVMTADGADYRITEDAYNTLVGLTGSDICGTYAQWLIYMNPNRIVSVEYQENIFDVPVSIPSPETQTIDSLKTALRYIGVVRGSGSTYTPGGIPLPDNTFQLLLRFDNDVTYTVSFVQDRLYLESSDMDFGCQYTLANPDIQSYFRELVQGTENTAQVNPLTAKPVIYLYPEQETDVEVKLDFQGELYYTFPAYDDGWTVTAQPDGTLTNHADGSTHYYLFWDGTADRKQWDLSSGFVVKGSEVQAFFQDILPELGLTPREYNDFITYWTPELSRNPYTLIHLSTEEYEQTAPLAVTPAPDTVIRVHFIFKALDEPIDIPQQQLPPTPQRKGFTVVEWGGTRA